MNVRDDFADIYLGARAKCFGYRLQPLSVAHLLYLSASKNPIATGHKFGPEHLLHAAKSCSGKVHKTRSGIYSIKPPKVSIRDSARLGIARGSKKYFTKQVQVFAAYWRYYLTGVEKAETARIPKPLSSPAILAQAIKASLSFGEERAWSMPYNLLSNTLEILNELEGGDTRFVADKDTLAEIQAELDKADEAGRELAAKIKARGGFNKTP